MGVSAMELPSPEELRQLLEASPVALLICDDQRIHYANTACANLLGYRDAAGVCELDPLEGVVSPPDQPAYRQALSGLLSGKAALEQLRPRVRRRDGTLIHSHVRAQSVSHRDGTRAFVTLVDASEERSSARDISRLARAVNLVSEAVLIAEADSTIVYANRAMGALIGTSAQALVGTKALDLAADEEAVRATMEGLSGPGPDRHFSVQADVRALTGRTFPAEVSVTVFREPEDGREMGIVVARDLTEARRLEEERVLRERQLGSMLREAHHRIKNNLQVASDLLALQSSAEAPAVREALGAAARRIRALAAVHEGIRADQDVTEVQAKPLIAAVVQDLAGTAGALGHGACFEVTVEDHPVTSRAASALALITAELVSNALEHADPGTVRVWFWRADAEAVLEVRDDGAEGPPAPDAAKAGFGLRLVRLLSEEQLRGGFSLAREDDWTVARVRFPLGGEPQ